MSLSTWISYILACILLIAPPGPTVTYLITTSMTHGKKQAYAIVWGSFWGGFLCLILSFIGLGTILTASTTLYTLLRLLGVAYLIYLGVKSLIDARKMSNRSTNITPPEKGEAFKNGFLLIFLNPKNIIFFASFLPQFLDNRSPFLIQMILLGVTYLFVGLITDYLYSFFASSIGRILGEHSEKWIASIGGMAMIVSAFIVVLQKF